MTRLKFTANGRTWERDVPRVDAGTLAEACEGIAVSSFEIESDYSKGELLGVDNKSIGSFRRVEVTP